MAIKLDIRPTPADVALAAADLIRREAHKAVREKGCFLLALAGGRTPNLLYEMLAREPFAGTMPWDGMHFFWGDERCVPPTHQDSNAGMAMKHLLSKVPVPARNVYPILGAGLPPRDAAELYEETVRQAFRASGSSGFTMVLLGMGNDGHTASLFPGQPAVAERIKWVAPAQAPSGQDRITITLPLIHASSTVLFMVTGRDKRDMLTAVLADQQAGLDRYPASMARGREQTIWLVDQEAAPSPEH